MPIYAYRCSSCDHAQDVLQKISDEPLTVCPACNEPSFAKQVTAAGFQLKGSGWYVTDFRDGGKKSDKKPDSKVDSKPETVSSPDSKSAESASAPKTESKPESKTESKAATPSPQA